MVWRTENGRRDNFYVTCGLVRVGELVTGLVVDLQRRWWGSGRVFNLNGGPPAVATVMRTRVLL